MLAPLQQDEIRILSLLPVPSGVDRTALIECEIEVAPLSNHPEYETLSYVWGVEKASLPVTVSGQGVKISQTLSNALLRLRLPDRKRLIWIDQLCIDQENVEEKTQQVQLMSKIYTECTRCIAWLGEVKAGISLASVEAAVQLFEYMAATWRTDDPDSIVLPTELRSDFNAVVIAIGTIEHRQNQWWDRIWTVQEAALPEELILQWGPFELPWSTIEAARSSWVTYSSEQLEPLLDKVILENDHVLGAFMSHVAWLGSAKDLANRPINMIHVYRIRQATDPRDGIYGLMGLIEKGRLPVTEQCDYSISAARVFNTMTKELIVDDGGLRALTCSPRQNPAQATPDIASWALDLNGSTPSFSPDLYYQVHVYETYDACAGLDQLDPDAIRGQIGAETLSLTGVYIDTVMCIQEGFKDRGSGEQTMPDTEVLLPVWYTAAVGCDSDGVYAGTSYNLREAFARLVLGDTVRNPNLNPSRGVSENDIENVGKLIKGQYTEVDMDIRRTVHYMMLNQNMVVTETGLIGSVTQDTQVGDQVWIFRGGKVPFVIRPRKDEGKGVYTFVAQCYVQGVMQGEMTEKKEILEQTVCLR